MARIANAPHTILPKLLRDGAKGQKVYFGTGLASPKGESRGFGFELLNTVLTALILMKEFGADGVLHEIGTIGYNIAEDKRSILVEEQLNLIARMTGNLGIENIYRVSPSHAYHSSDSFKAAWQEADGKLSLFSGLPNFQKYGEYTVIQTAQMRYLHYQENATVKVGWIIGRNPALERVDADMAARLINQGHLNEYYFDSIYRYVFPEDEFSFLYTLAGIDMLNGLQYAPYTITGSQNRPLLTDPIRSYMSGIPDSRHKRKALALYKKTIADSYEELFGKIVFCNALSEQERLIHKLQHIQDKVLGVFSDGGPRSIISSDF